MDERAATLDKRQQLLDQREAELERKEKLLSVAGQQVRLIAKQSSILQCIHGLILLFYACLPSLCVSISTVLSSMCFVK